MKCVWLVLVCLWLSACSDDTQTALPTPSAEKNKTVSESSLRSPEPANQLMLSIKDGLVTISAVDVSQPELLQKLAELAGFGLRMNYDNWSSVSLTLSNAPVEFVIKAILGPIPHKIYFRPDVQNPARIVKAVMVGEQPASSAAAAAAIGQSVARHIEDMKLPKQEQLEQVAPITKDQVMAMSDEEKVNVLPYVEASPANIPVLVDFLKTYPDADVRIAAMSSLENTEDPQALQAIIDACADSDPKIVLAAIDSIEFAGSEANISALQPLLQHPNPDVQAAARDAIEFLR